MTAQENFTSKVCGEKKKLINCFIRTVWVWLGQQYQNKNKLSSKRLHKAINLRHFAMFYFTHCDNGCDCTCVLLLH